MKKTVFFALAPLLFFGCANNFEDKKEQLDLVVERNEKCEKYREVLEEKINYPQWIEEVFYSPKTESCLAIYSTYDDNIDSSLVDIFSKEVVADIDINFKTTDLSVAEQDEKVKAFDQTVAEYKKLN